MTYPGRRRKSTIFDYSSAAAIEAPWTTESRLWASDKSAIASGVNYQFAISYYAGDNIHLERPENRHAVCE